MDAKHGPEVEPSFPGEKINNAHDVVFVWSSILEGDIGPDIVVAVWITVVAGFACPVAYGAGDKEPEVGVVDGKKLDSICIVINHNEIFNNSINCFWLALLLQLTWFNTIVLSWLSHSNELSNPYKD